MMEVMVAKAFAPSFARLLFMIAIGPRIDPHKLYRREVLEALLSAGLLRFSVPKAATIDGPFGERPCCLQMKTSRSRKLGYSLLWW